MNLLDTYLHLEKIIDMELMLQEKIYITYYENVSAYKDDMFFLDDQEFQQFIIDYTLDSKYFLQSFIILNDLTLDTYVIWDATDDLTNILSFLSAHPKYEKFII